LNINIKSQQKTAHERFFVGFYLSFNSLISLIIKLPAKAIATIIPKFGKSKTDPQSAPTTAANSVGVYIFSPETRNKI